MSEKKLIYEYDGTVYEFKLTWNARNEIDKLQRANNISKIASLKDPKVARLAMEKEKIDNMLENCTEAEKNELEKKQREIMIEMIPYASELTDKSAEIDPLEIAYIVLKNTKAHKDISREKFNEIIEDMDDKRGVIEVYDFLTDVQEMVFTQMDEMQKRQASKMEKFQNIQA